MSTYEERVLETMLRHMESHLYFARRQITKLGILGEETYTKMWLDLTKQLNDLDLNQHRSPEEWQDFWKSLRLENKQKVSKYLKWESSTGNLPNEINLTDFDVRVSKIFGRFGTGLAIVPEFGIKPMDNAINPLDLFENRIEKRSSKQRGIKPVSSVDVGSISNEQKLELVQIMSENIDYAIDEEEDVDNRIALNLQLEQRLSALEGAKKDSIQWKTCWENMYRCCTENSPSNNEFVNLIAAFKRIPKKNTNKRMLIMNKILKHIHDLKTKSKSVVKTEIKEEEVFQEIIVLDDDETNIVNSQKKELKRERDQEFKSVTKFGMPSISKPSSTRTLPDRQTEIDKNPVRTIVHGNSMDVDVIQTILKSLVADEVKTTVPISVNKILDNILSSPQFIHRLKELFKADIQDIAEKLYLKWRSNEEEQVQQEAESLFSQRYSKPFQELSNFTNQSTITSTKVSNPGRKVTSSDAFSDDYQDTNLENLPPPQMSDETFEEDIFEQNELPNASQAEATAEVHYNSEEEYEDGIDSSIPQTPTRTPKRSLPYEFDLNELATFRRPNGPPQRESLSPTVYSSRSGAVKENPSKLRSTWRYRPSL